MDSASFLHTFFMHSCRVKLSLLKLQLRFIYFSGIKQSALPLYLVGQSCTSSGVICSSFNEDMALPCCGKVCFVTANEVFQPFYLLIPPRTKLRTTKLRTVLFPGNFIIEENHGVTFSILFMFTFFFFLIFIYL